MMPNQDDIGTIRQKPGYLYVPYYAVRVLDENACPVWQYVSFNTAISDVPDDADLSGWPVVYTYKPLKTDL